MTTYSRATWQEAQAAWDAGEFSDEWTPFRTLAARQGILYPPSGTRWDSWEDDEPSARAILVRAIRETPALLRMCIRGSRSWSSVIGRLTSARDDWRAQLAQAESVVQQRRRDEQADRCEAHEFLGEIIRRQAAGR